MNPSEAYNRTADLVGEMLQELPDDQARARYLWLVIGDARNALGQLMKEVVGH